MTFTPDPWYFQSDQSFWFVVPDKVQHFYGSRLLARRFGPLASLAAGVVWELGQGTTGTGYSWRDVLVDGLGVASAMIRGPTGLYCVWDPSEKIITVQLAVIF